MFHAIERFNAEISANVEGWLGPRQAMIVDMLHDMQSEAGITGDIAEIGVHHGQFLFLLASVRSESEKAHAFDVFEDQSANIDRSGCGSREIFEAGISRWFDPAHFQIHKVDSLSMQGKAKAYLPQPVRLFSVDGGHTRRHVANDLAIANETICAGGVVILDDFYAILWPGVTEGYFDYMRSAQNRLAPFLYFENKLFLTTREEHGAALEAMQQRLSDFLGGELANGLWKMVELSGQNVLALGRP